MRILVLGRSGQVGRSLRNRMPDAVYWGRDQLDLADPARVGRTVRDFAPACIVNAAAYTAVDRAESEPEAARAINTEAAGELASAAEKLGIPLLHISTDYVFSGDLDRPYRETDPTGPRSVYGRTKLAGEEAVRERCERHWILRTSWIFSQYGHNFVKSMVRLGAEREVLSIVDDQVGRPTFAGDLACLVAEIVERWAGGQTLAWGTWHAANHGAVSWCGFASAIFELAVAGGALPRAPRLEPIPTEAYPTPAARPANSRLDTGKLESAFGMSMPHWRSGLALTLELLRRGAVSR